MSFLIESIDFLRKTLKNPQKSSKNGPKPKNLTGGALLIDVFFGWNAKSRQHSKYPEGPNFDRFFWKKFSDFLQFFPKILPKMGPITPQIAGFIELYLDFIRPLGLNISITFG